MTAHRYLLGLAVGLGIVWFGTARAQPAAVRGVFGGGGGTAGGATHRVRVTFGQAVAGRISGPSNQGHCGFWYTTRPLSGASESQLPLRFALDQSYPNPCRGPATIRYALPRASNAELRIYDVHGRQVGVLLRDNQPPGYHELVFDTSALSPGLYVYRLKTEGFRATRKMVVVR